MIFLNDEEKVAIAYRKWCQIHDFQRRFSFGSRDQAWSLKSFCVAEFYYSEKGTEKASDKDIRRGTESAPLTSVTKGVTYFLN